MPCQERGIRRKATATHSYCPDPLRTQSGKQALGCPQMYRIISSLQTAKSATELIQSMCFRIRLGQTAIAPWLSLVRGHTGKGSSIIEQSGCHPGLAGVESFQRKIRDLGSPAEPPVKASCKPLQQKTASSLLSASLGCNFLHATFVLRSGIFVMPPPHLTNLGTGAGATRAEARLTCLFLRCLSSYLIFPPVPVTQQAASGWAKHRSPARGPTGLV